MTTFLEVHKKIDDEHLTKFSKLIYLILKLYFVIGLLGWMPDEAGTELAESEDNEFRRIGGQPVSCSANRSGNKL
jgi:hypothetical protein